MKTDLFLKCKVYKYLNNYVTLKTISTIKIRSMVWWLYWLQSIRYKSVTWYYPFTAVADFLLLYFCIWIALYSKIVQHGWVVCTCLRTWLVCVLQTQVICVRLPTWLLLCSSDTSNLRSSTDIVTLRPSSYTGSLHFVNCL